MPPAMSAMLERHEQAYEEAMSFILEPPEGVEIVQIAPELPLRSQVFGSRSEDLMADYASGCQAGEAALVHLKRWLYLSLRDSDGPNASHVGSTSPTPLPSPSPVTTAPSAGRVEGVGSCLMRPA